MLIGGCRGAKVAGEAMAAVAASGGRARLAGEVGEGGAQSAGVATKQGAKLINCFPPGALVGTEAGLRPIAQVEAGQRVWAYDFQGGTWRQCVVECRHDAIYDGPLVTLDIGVGEVTATAYHPFWVVEGQDLESRPALRHVDVSEDRGESLPGRWVNSHDL